MWTFIGDVLIFIGACIFMWRTKDWFLTHFKGASAVAADLRAKAAKLEATLRTL